MTSAYCDNTLVAVGIADDMSVSNPLKRRMRLDGPLQELTYRVIGAAMETHDKLGPGLKESAYHHALSLELQTAGLSCQEEKAVEIVLEGKSNWSSVPGFARG
ncbi:MAG TPA: GxxExxY protein, partial [Dehalococcoidia bacterium]|nr:GxxExxY protein [Dehalococcoidia bacterium]